MALTKEVVIDKIEILENGIIQTREVTRILEDGEVISKKYTNRQVIDVEDDVSDKDDRVKDIAGVVWTADVKAKRKAEKLKNK